MFLYILGLLFYNHMVMSVHLSIGNNEEDEKTKLLVKWNFILKYWFMLAMRMKVIKLTVMLKERVKKVNDVCSELFCILFSLLLIMNK